MDKKRVLIVEDDASSRTALKYMLARQGWHVAAAETLAEGFRVFLAQPFDSIVLDLMLPDGNGEQLLEHVRTHNPATRVAVTTGAMDAARIDHVKSLGPSCILIKPIKLDELLAQL